MAVQLIHQQQTIKGIVVDASGEPVIGANVVVEGTTMGTITDFEGTFSISVPKNGKIKISFIGYKDQVLTPQSGKNLRVVLEDDSQMLGEVQVVAYGAQKKVSITGAISSMKGEDLLKTPAASMSNVLSGQITGISSVQYSGEPGADEADLYVRGIATWNNAKPLIQVDGVEREFSQIDPNEVESITVLKDASATAVFGVRGANGVILITTKRGAEGKAKISFSTSAGVNLRTKQLEFANSYQYASYYNDLQVNDGGVPTFTEEQLIKFRDHTDPILYPDINWIDYCMNKAAFQSQHNVNISGGTDRMRYFVSAGMFTQDGMFKQLAASDNFNFNYKRYNYRANLDFDATKTTLISVNIGGRIETKRTPESGEDQNQLFRKLYWAVPFAGAGIVDGKRVVSNADYLPFTGSDGLNSYYGKGFRSTTTNVLNVDLVLDQKLDFITKGLSFKLKGSYNTSYWTQKIASSSMAVYTPVLHDDGSIGYRKSGSDSQLSYSRNSNGEGKSRDWYMEAALNYSRKFGDHNVTGLVLYNQSKRYYPGGTYDDIPSAYVGFVGRATYDYKTRYMAEFNVGYNGSENFAPGKRYGLFPAGSIGWIVSEESFFKPLKKVINYFKVRASVGMVGNDNNGNNRFLYLPDAYILNDDGYFFGTNAGNKKPGAYEASKSNADVTWEKSVKQNYGIDFSILNEKLNISLDYFKENRRDILSSPDYMPGILGMVLPIMLSLIH
ncbi:TonB-dependent receptor, partial [Phocaeicola vulgatus]